MLNFRRPAARQEGRIWLGERKVPDLQICKLTLLRRNCKSASPAPVPGYALVSQGALGNLRTDEDFEKISIQLAGFYLLLNDFQSLGRGDGFLIGTV
jgi:hypothetical protein